MAMKWTILMVACGLCQSLAITLACVSLGSTHWVESSDSSLDLNSGLWQNCALGTCSRWSNPAEYISATRASLILAILTLIASAVTLGLSHCYSKYRVNLYLTTFVLLYVGAVCIMIAFAVWAGEWSGNSVYDFGHGFALCIVSFVLALASGVCTTVAFVWMKKDPPCEQAKVEPT